MSIIVFRFVEGNVVYMTELPNDQHITYQLQHRKCGKTSCSTCRNGQGHGPYWYAYWRDGARLRSGYVGKVNPYMTNPEQPINKKTEVTAPIMVTERIAEAVLV